MNTDVTDVITSYKSRTINTLRDQQSALTPCVDPFILDCQVFEYIYDNQRYLVNPSNEACFRCRYMYMKHMEPQKYIQYATSKEYMDYLVAEEIIDPFLFFINGKMFPWSMMRILMTHEEYYIFCEIGDPYWLEEIKNVTSIAVIHLPSSSVYANFAVGNASNKIFAFDYEGKLSDNESAPFSILNESQYINFTTVSIEDGEGINAYPISKDTNIKFYPNNVILFRNGILDTTANIQFISTLLTVDNGLNVNGDKLDLIIFNDTRTKDTVDNIKNVNLDYIRPYVQDQNAGKDVPEYIELLEEQFDFEMSRKKTYETNVDESINYIMGYNSSLFEEAYQQGKTLSIEEKTGQWVIDNTREDGTLLIPRKHGEFTEEYIIMLVNGILYKFYYTMTYTADYCIIPIKDITAEDVVEFLRFSDINNNTFDLVVREDDPYIEYDSNYINTNMILFSTIPPTDDFEFPEDGLQHFPIPYKIEYAEDGVSFRIRFDDAKYYGQPMKVAYAHQFRHYWFNVSSEDAGNGNNYKLDLGTKFMYCHDYSKFLIFFNGRRLSTDQYRLCLPVRSTTPFYRFELYLTMYVSEGDRVDIIYTPSLLKDVALYEEIDNDGIIDVSKENITYALTKNNYMVWANGKKIPASQIANIDSTRLRLIYNIDTLKYVCITKYLPDIDELTEVFKSSTALWDTIMANFTDEEISEILNYEPVTITNTEEDIYASSVHVRSVMLELIREKYIANNLVDTTQPFVYDYLDVDQAAVEDYDAGDNALLLSADANLTENIDGIEREWP